MILRVISHAILATKAIMMVRPIAASPFLIKQIKNSKGRQSMVSDIHKKTFAALAASIVVVGEPNNCA